tara:strand:+ start:1310 stop:2902 length:1593 start_codon:yes stop_codon:yes gene_type:complete
MAAVFVVSCDIGSRESDISIDNNLGQAEIESKMLKLSLGPIRTLDPAFATTRAEFAVIDRIFEPLVRINDDGMPEPAAAEKWQILNSASTYIFTLREGLRWSDGYELTAFDFEFAWERSLHPDSGSLHAYLLFPIDGASDYNEGTGNDVQAVGIQALDKFRLKVELSEPSVGFLARTSLWNFVPVPKHLVENDPREWASRGKIVSNGPMGITSWTDDHVKLSANIEYRSTKDVSENELLIELPNMDYLPLESFRSGGVDVLALDANLLARVRSDSALMKNSAVLPGSGNWFLVFDVDREPWSNVKVRQAISLALDREELVAHVFEGVELPSKSLIPHNVLGESETSAFGPDVSAAQMLLEEAGYPGGAGLPSIVLVTNDTPRWERLAVELDSQLSAALGIGIKIEQKKFREYIEFTQNPGDFHLYRAGWSSEYPDPANWLSDIWDSETNFMSAGWVNHEYDKLVQSAMQEVDLSERWAKYRDAKKILDGELPAIPIADRAVAFLVSERVTGVNISATGDYLLIDKVQLES